MRADYVNPEVYKRVYHLLTYENALALRLSLETGLRISDVLKIEAADLQGRQLRYTAQKTGKEGKKTLSAELARRLKQIAGSKWVFTGRFGDKPRTRQAVWKDVKKAADQLKIQSNLSVHSARKTYSVELFHREGLGRVQKELQHSRLDTTMLYAFSDLLNGQPQADSSKDAILNEILILVKEVHAKICGEKK